VEVVVVKDFEAEVEKECEVVVVVVAKDYEEVVEAEKECEVEEAGVGAVPLVVPAVAAEGEVEHAPRCLVVVRSIVSADADH
jgi:hypothetical protein